MGAIVIEGRVVEGRRLGRRLGFPTANLAVPAELTAADGVYASCVEVDGHTYDAMSNLGRNPSVGGSERHLESHLFAYEGSLYGRMVRVTLLDYVRGEMTFASVEALRKQIEEDEKLIRKILNQK